MEGPGDALYAVVVRGGVAEHLVDGTLMLQFGDGRGEPGVRGRALLAELPQLLFTVAFRALGHGLRQGRGGLLSQDPQQEVLVIGGLGRCADHQVADGVRRAVQREAPAPFPVRHRDRPVLIAQSPDLGIEVGGGVGPVGGRAGQAVVEREVGRLRAARTEGANGGEGPRQDVALVRRVIHDHREHDKAVQVRQVLAAPAVPGGPARRARGRGHGGITGLSRDSPGIHTTQ